MKVKKRELRHRLYDWSLTRVRAIKNTFMFYQTVIKHINFIISRITSCSHCVENDGMESSKRHVTLIFLLKCSSKSSVINCFLNTFLHH